MDILLIILEVTAYLLLVIFGIAGWCDILGIFRKR